MSVLNTTFNEDFKNGLTFIGSTIFDKFIGKNVKALKYFIQQLNTKKNIFAQRQFHDYW